MHHLACHSVNFIFVFFVLLSTHADRQGVDISAAVVCLSCSFVFFCVCIRLRISPARIKPASNFVRWFVGVLDRESPILGNFAPPEAPNRTNRLRSSRWAARAWATRACAQATRRIGMCGYTAVPED